MYQYQYVNPKIILPNEKKFPMKFHGQPQTNFIALRFKFPFGHFLLPAFYRIPFTKMIMHYFFIF